MVSYLAFSLVLGFFVGTGRNSDDVKLKLSECPEVVQTSLKTEAGAAKIDLVTRETDEDGEVTYSVDINLSGKMYAINVLADGTLSEMTLGIDVDEVAFDRLSAAIQATFRAEGYGQKIESVGKDLKFGVAVYETVVDHKGRKYEVVVAEDGTLVEKVLVIDDEEVEFSKCPAAVQAILTRHAGAGSIQEVTRYAGIIKPTYEAEVEIRGKVYLIEVDESGHLISKSLEADVEA